MPSKETLPSAPSEPVRKPRYWIKTYGCQMNVHDSEIYAGLFTDMGYEEAGNADEADVVLVNTCSVRERAEDKLFSRLGELRQMKEALLAGSTGAGARKVLVGVTGCIAQQRGKEIMERAPGVDFVIGTRAIHNLPEVLAAVQEGAGPQVMIEDRVQFEAPGARRQDRVKAFVTIMEGCNNYCSFCIVPTTRGFEIYRSAEAIIDEIRGLSLRGYREVTLLGQNVNSWLDPESAMGFPDLLRAIDAALESEHQDGGVQRVRFLTSHPKDLSPNLIEVMGDCERVAKHLHLPVQSGSDRVLHRMNRNYTVETYSRQVEALRRTLPDVGLSTDLIVGFPGESEAEFEATLELVRKVRYDSFYSFEYSPRPETAAVTQYDDDVPAEVKRARLLELQRVGQEIQAEQNDAWIGRLTTVLIDGTSKRSPQDVTGRTSSNHIVNLAGDRALVGSLAEVEIIRSGLHSLYGALVSEPV